MHFFKNWLYKFFLFSDMLYMYPFMILFAIFRNRDHVDFFLHTSKFEKMGDFESKSKQIWPFTRNNHINCDLF